MATNESGLKSLTNIEETTDSEKLNPSSAGLRALHEDEKGLTTIEIVLLLFVAVIILIGLISYFNDKVWTAITGAINKLLNFVTGK